MMLEHLVLLSPNDQGATAAVQQRCRVVSALPPRLLVVAADEQAAKALLDLPGVDDVISELTSTLPSSLNETERLFVEAWQQGRQSHAKQRPGDGLNWDAEGYSPPDRPHSAPR